MLLLIQNDQGKPFETRKMQETVPEGGLCNTMIPPSPLAPDDSSCWQWYTPPPDGVLPPGAPKPPTGCDYEPCKNAVCECDSYCCDTAWDLSCRGYYMKQGDTIENNYFVPGCSAKLLCCEQESAFPDPPIGAAMAGAANLVKVNPAFAAVETTFACTPGTKGCCDTMIPPSYLPPDDSTCWQWWDPPADGVMKPDMPPPPKGCNYTPCQDAVCACDSYCCDTAWDLSCRGYHLHSEDTVDNNYFVDGCSAKMLCCEPESAFPDPPVGGALAGGSSTTIIEKVSVVEKVNMVKVAVPVSQVAVPVQVAVAVPAGSKINYNVGVNVAESSSTTVSAATVNESVTITQTGKGGTKAPKGSKGCKGSKKGSKGKSGKSGKKGKSGKSGKEGKSGKSGSKSSKGTKGPKSSKGTKGPKSSKGSKKGSKCPDDMTMSPTISTDAPTVSPTESSTGTGTFTGTATFTTTLSSTLTNLETTTLTETLSVIP